MHLMEMMKIDTQFNAPPAELILVRLYTLLAVHINIKAYNTRRYLLRE